MQNNQALINVLTNLQIEETKKNGESHAAKFQLLVAFIADLIKNDFNRLLSILYRVDISEQKLKIKLAENKELNIRSAELIANLFIERENEKIISREKYR